MTSIDSLVLDVPDVDPARTFYDAAFGPLERLELRESDVPSSGFRGYSLSLIVAQPADADSLFDTAVAAGAKVVKPPKKSMWGYGAVVEAPDGAIWKVVSDKRKNKGPTSRVVQEIVLLLGVADVAASKEFYVERGLEVSRSFGRKYAEFASDTGVKLALLKRAEVAKDAGVPEPGGGSHRIALRGIGSFTDPDGFVGEADQRADRA